MNPLHRWAGNLSLGPFRFQTSAGEPHPLTLRNKGGRMVSEDGRDFGSADALRAVPSLNSGALPVIVVQEEAGPGLCVVWPDARGIDTPDTFRARILGE